MYDLLNELRASGSQSVGTENGDGVDLGPGGEKVVECLNHVTVVGSSGVQTLHLEQSDDDSTFYQVPGSEFKDPDDGADINEVGLYKVQCKITMRYVRTVSVVATAAITWQAYLTKV